MGKASVPYLRSDFSHKKKPFFRRRISACPDNFNNSNRKCRGVLLWISLNTIAVPAKSIYRLFRRRKVVIIDGNLRLSLVNCQSIR